MSSSAEQPAINQSKPNEPFNLMAALLGSGIRLPMAADEPFEPRIPELRRRVPAAQTVLARCNGEVFLIFAGRGDRDVLPVKKAMAAVRSDSSPRTLTVTCDLPADVNRLGHIVAEMRDYRIVGVEGQFIRRPHQRGGHS